MALDQITKANVAQLAIAWKYPTRDNDSYLFNPIVVGDTMYLLVRGSSRIRSKTKAVIGILQRRARRSADARILDGSESQ